MTRPHSVIRIEGDVAYVSLTEGFEARISAEDVPLVAGRRWVVRLGKYGHAYAHSSADGKIVAMHRLLLNAPVGMWVDHKDGDGLNNVRSNIRLCTPQQNMANKAVERRNRLGLKGVSQKKNKYRARIKPAGKMINLGYYSTPEEAAAAYKGAARVLWGRFAKE